MPYRTGWTSTVKPHRSTTYVDAAYCYRPSSVVCRSVCLPVCRSLYGYVTLVSSAKTAEPIEMPFGLWARMGRRNHVLDGVQRCWGTLPWQPILWRIWFWFFLLQLRSLILHSVNFHCFIALYSVITYCAALWQLLHLRERIASVLHWYVVNSPVRL